MHALLVVSPIALLLGAPIGSPQSPDPTASRRAPAPALTIIPPPQRLSLLDTRSASFTIVTGDSAVHNLRVVHSTLQDATTAALLGAQWLQVCALAGTPCQPASSIAPHRSEPVLLTVDTGFRSPGVFTGSVSVAVDESPDPRSFELTVSSSTPSRRHWGVALIALAVLASACITILRHRITRGRALMPAVQVATWLRDSKAAIEQAERQIGQPNDPAAPRAELTETKSRIDKDLQNLSENSLIAMGYVPPRVPLAFAAPADKSAEYKQLLTQTATSAAIVAELLTVGLRPLVERWKAPKDLAALLVVWRTLDALGRDAQTPAEVRPKAEAAIRTYDGQAGIVQSFATSSNPHTATVNQLIAQEVHANGLLWLGWGVMTVFAGWAAVIAPNAGFGTSLDFVKCVFWGLGLQAVGQQLQQLTPSTVAATFGVTISR
jgi:hypothetical protein